MKRARTVKTLGSLVARQKSSTECHVHQFQIACLELERTRRLKERLVALSRVEEIDKRLLAIEVEVRRHLDAIVSVHASRQAAGMGPQPTASEAQPERRRRTFRY